MCRVAQSPSSCIFGVEVASVSAASSINHTREEHSTPYSVLRTYTKHAAESQTGSTQRPSFWTGPSMNYGVLGGGIAKLRCRCQLLRVRVREL